MGFYRGPNILGQDLNVAFEAGSGRSYPGSGTTWINLKGNNMSLVAGPTFVSSTPSYFNFDGIDDYGTFNYVYPSQWSEPLTIECWLFVPSSATWSNGFNGNIIGRGSYAGSQGLVRTTSNNIVAMYMRNASTTSQASATITRDAWTYLAGTWDGARTRIYVNGNLINTSGATTPTGVPGTGNWEVARNKAFVSNVGNFYTGRISSIRMYSRLLTNDEITNNFNSQKALYGL